MPRSKSAPPPPAQAAKGQRYSKAVKGIGLPETPTAIINEKAQGEAMSLAALFGSITANAGPYRDRYKIYPASGLTPTKLYGFLRQADIGIVHNWQEIIQQALRRDGRLASVDRGRRVAVIGRPYSIRPCNDSDEAIAMAAFVQECLDGISGWKRGLRFLLGAPCAGFAANEPIYRYRRVRFPYQKRDIIFDALAVEELRRVHGKHFQFNTDNNSDEPLPAHGRVLQLEGQTPLLNVAAGSIYLPRHKFIFHVSGEDGRIEERGWMRVAIWLHMLKQKAIAQWGEFVGRFGLPNVRGEVPYNIWTDQKRATAYAKFLEIYGDGFATLMPNDLKVVLDQVQVGPSGKGAFDTFIGWIDTQNAILVQGEHLTTEIGDAGSYNAADVQRDEKRAVVEEDNEALAETLRDQFFWSLIWLNRQDLSHAMNVDPWLLLKNRPLIVFRLDAQTSRKERLEEFDIARNKLGMDIADRQIRDEANFDPIGPTDRRIPGAPQNLPADSKTVSTSDAIAGATNPKLT